MRLRPRLAIFAFLLFAVAPVFAQTPSIATETVSETPTRLKTLTASDVRRIAASAESGDPVDQYWLGQIYEDGRLVPKDDNLARKWTLKSADQNFGAAEYAMLRWDSSDSLKKERWLRRAAEDGEAGSQMWLGVAYEQNWFGTTDLVEAAKWYQRSADQGNPDAQAALGEMYESGDGLTQDYSQAAEWYRRAAEHVPDFGGAGSGRWHLAYLYMDGKGVEKNYIEACMWFMLSGDKRIPKDLESLVTPGQIRQARELADEWEKRHPDPDRKT